MNEGALSTYISTHCDELDAALRRLDPQWRHGGVVATWLEDTRDQLKYMALAPLAGQDEAGTVRDRKTEKYTGWAEVMRLASFQYQRFAPKGKAKSEGLYATLLSQAVIWGRPQGYRRIVVPGCGPGRSVLDFARAFPQAQVIGLDYSFPALVLGERIVCGTEKTDLLRRDVCDEEELSQVLPIPGFNLKNAEFCLCDLVDSEIPGCDMIVCSNIVNLLPEHRTAVEKLCAALEPGGLLVFADLIGWRIDREPQRKLLCSDERIRRIFEEFGMETLDQFSGVPYIESESDDQDTLYHEHFYIARKKQTECR